MPAEIVRYSDWKIAKRHAELVTECLPPKSRAIKVTKQIPGFAGGRIGKGFRAGNFLMPMASEVVMTFSDRHDVARRSLLVMGLGTTSTDAECGEPPMMAVAECLRNKFAHRRAVMLNGELYSFIDNRFEYTVDEQIMRKYDILVLSLVSTMREDR